MEERGILDVNSEIDIFSLHYVFLPKIQRSLHAFQMGWNNHPMSSEGGTTMDTWPGTLPWRLFAHNISKDPVQVLLYFHPHHYFPLPSFNAIYFRLMKPFMESIGMYRYQVMMKVWIQLLFLSQIALSHWKTWHNWVLR